jgi:hypothetical protein
MPNVRITAFSTNISVFWKLENISEFIIIFLHGLGRLTCSGIEALPSFPRASTISSSSRLCVFVYEYFIFLGRVTSPSAKPPFLEDQLVSFVWLLSYGLSGLVGPVRNKNFFPA